MKKIAILISTLLITTGVMANTGTGINHKKSNPNVTYGKAKQADTNVNKMGTKAK